MRQALPATLLVLLLGCDHAEPFGYMPPRVDPPAPAADTRLTLNSDQDYWPAWTEDGRGILYSFVDPGANLLHRCIGLLPATGGQRLWQLCDNRATERDSASTFPGYALDSTGRILYTEAVSTNKQLTPIPKVTLWLADSATPFTRTALLTLPVASASGVTWLSEIRWTGPNTFVALGQLFETAPQCFPKEAVSCGAQDSVFFESGSVLTGTIAAGHATLQPISGTAGATSYSLATGGNTVVFTVANDLRLWKVPTIGGAPTVVTTINQTGGATQLLGVSCQGTTCVVASAPISLTSLDPEAGPHLNTGTAAIAAVSLTTGATQALISNATANLSLAPPTIYATPQLSPAGGNVVAQVGGTWWGHLQTFSGGGNGDLHLYPGIVQ